MIIENKIKLLENKKNNLERKNIDLIIADFDNTIFCRKDQLKDSELLRTNRWDKWNDVIRDIIWIENTIKMYYSEKEFPKTITSKLRENHDLILTAWYEDIQTAKLKSTKLNHINYNIVTKAEDKIMATIEYIVNKLGFIPNKLTVYEDRPKYFIEYKDFLEDFLWIEIEIMYVKMNGNSTEPKIKKLKI